MLMYPCAYILLSDCNDTEFSKDYLPYGNHNIFYVHILRLIVLFNFNSIINITFLYLSCLLLFL